MEKTMITEDPVMVMVTVMTMIREHLKGLELLHFRQTTTQNLPVLIESTILENTVSKIGVLVLSPLLKT
jgi:hypothetical protein